MRRIRWFALLFLAGFLALPTFAQKKLSASEAKEHFAETATVCGEVVSTRYADSTKGQPTFLNLDKPYPNQVFTIVIWGNNRSKFGTPENDYKGKRICVTGKITAYAGLPEIVVDEPKQIKIDAEKYMHSQSHRRDLVQVFAIKFLYTGEAARLTELFV